MGSNNLETIITMNELGLQDSIPRHPNKKNISDDQARAVTSNVNSVIKPAHKGEATVIQNQSDYLAEGLRQLSDQNYYRRLDDVPTDDHNRMVVSNLEDMRLNGEITERAAPYLVTEEPHTPQLYLLPKNQQEHPPSPGETNSLSQ